MLTNPNTLGLFDENVLEVIRIVHEAGGLVYGDGANMNALLGIVRPGDLGIDVMHFNLHKTFSTPHGGGGPGSGPVGVAAHLVDFLPEPVVGIVEAGDDETPPLYGFMTPPTQHRTGQILPGAVWDDGARLYLHPHARTGRVAQNLRICGLERQLFDGFTAQDPTICPTTGFACMNLCWKGNWADAPDIHALDIAKRMMDYDLHPPTNYFPLIVHEALMIEPTETESKQTLDAFVEIMQKIAEEAHTQPELLKTAPHITPVGRLDEVKAAKDLVLCCGVDSLE